MNYSSTFTGRKSPLFLLTLFCLLSLVWVTVSTADEVGGALEPDGAWMAPPPHESEMPAAVAEPVRATAVLTGTDQFSFLPIAITAVDSTTWIETSSRTAVLEAYQADYSGSENNDDGWTGNHGSCNAGTTSATFRNSILKRINYFRRMAGIPPLEGLNETYNAKAQQAALMMSVNGSLSHSPPSSWTCYTADGKQAAGSSNLYLGRYGPSAISGYIYDPGGGNYFVGHRRWILYPRTRFMGTGDIPSKDGKSRSNALWVFDADKHSSRPETRESYVAWPPPGYVPYQVIYPRWSFAYDKANFSGASVTMTRNGAPVSLSVNALANGYGENTLVWEPNTTIEKPAAGDVVFKVTINNVVISGSPQSFTYDVIMIDPDS